MLVIDNKTVSIVDGLYSLNDLHRASGGAAKDQPSNWLRLDYTRELIDEINLKAVIPALVESKAGRYGGTYVCKELVYAYAMWLSPSFYARVIRTFDAVASGDIEKALAYAGTNSSLKRLERIKDEKKALFSDIEKYHLSDDEQEEQRLNKKRMICQRLLEFKDQPPKTSSEFGNMVRYASDYESKSEWLVIEIVENLVSLWLFSDVFVGFLRKR